MLEDVVESKQEGCFIDRMHCMIRCLNDLTIVYCILLKVLYCSCPIKLDICLSNEHTKQNKTVLCMYNVQRDMNALQQPIRRFRLR